jgi:predicted unusual protein kinase regulating ubiquinone biosynthesis (AarF/ABC1/UbiB family)
MKRIPATALERSLRVVGFGIQSGITAITRTRSLLQQAEALTKMLGQMKGSMMKAGQLLGLVGEHFFPPEINAVLRTLNAKSEPVEWAVIERTLRRRLGAEKFALLDIEKEPLAAASLGQVHRAMVRSSGRVICLKIQYPGVGKAIEGDLRNLRALLKMSGILPVEINEKIIFDEVREMLRREVDYGLELKETQDFRALVDGDSRFVVPDVIEEFSGPRILATQWIDSFDVESEAVRTMGAERRNLLAESFLEFFFKEYFIWHRVQTDPHFGNYKVRPGKNGGPDQLVLLDFGAVRQFPSTFVRSYAGMVRAALDADPDLIAAAGKKVGILPADASHGMTDAFVQLCLAVVEPFSGRKYDWRENDLPKRTTALGLKLVVEQKLPSPPREMLFLDRKLGGVFVFLSHLGARLNGRPMLEEAIDQCLQNNDHS